MSLIEFNFKTNIKAFEVWYEGVVKKRLDKPTDRRAGRLMMLPEVKTALKSAYLSGCYRNFKSKEVSK